MCGERQAVCAGNLRGFASLLVTRKGLIEAKGHTMSAQFGWYRFDGKPVEQAEIAGVSGGIAAYGPDGIHSYSKDYVRILYAAFETHGSSHELQPFVLPSGAILTFDGRLDNGEDLVRDLRGLRSSPVADVEIVAAAFDNWGTDALNRLVGDWALSVWTPETASLLLAKDTIGTRPLYYFFDRNEIRWSSALELLLRYAGRTFALDKEYVAGCLSFYPASHLTPYLGVHSVPPSSYVLLRNSNAVVREYWRFDPDKRIRYRSDSEYEEHFRTVFASSVARRLRSNYPVLAELSGGMDSASIVCLADTLMSNGIGCTPRLDTISYYDDSEPNWNELPYIAKVEAKRGRTGCHINVGSSPKLPWMYDRDSFAPIPGSAGNPALRTEFASCLAKHGNRVVLSGVGGDEVLGGVPDYVPELSDLLTAAELKHFWQQLTEWALTRRKPVFHLALDTIRAFLPRNLGGLEKVKRPVSWLKPAFVRKHHHALRGYDQRLRLFGPLPSFQDNVQTLEALRRQLAWSSASVSPPYEKCYPYLDRDLLEFLYAVPRDQIVRANQRRSLMRRALAGIVPADILGRRRKAFVVRSPVVSIIAEWPSLMNMVADMVSDTVGVVHADCFAQALRETRDGRPVSLARMMRTLDLENWLRHAREFGILHVPDSCRSQIMSGIQTAKAGSMKA